MSTPTSSTMNLEKLQRVALKVFFTPQTASTFKTREVIPVFHRWIQTQAVDGLLIDVADYTHLPTGPAVILIAHEGQYSIDWTLEQDADPKARFRVHALSSATATLDTLVARLIP